MRPAALAEVAVLAASGEDFDRCLAEFLDSFYAAPTAAALAAEPLLQGTNGDWAGQVRDAYLAAVADQLAADYGFRRPLWTGQERRALRRPWFASSMPSLRATLIRESPAAFRARNLFVSENALSRA